VVHGHGNLDELTTAGVNRVSEFRDGQVQTYTLDPQEYGFATSKPEDIAGGTPQENADITRGILDKSITGAPRDVVILNAGAGLMAGGIASDLRDGFKRAQESIDSGAALARLNALVEHSNKFVVAQ